jgi:hypothetical protein
VFSIPASRNFKSQLHLCENINKKFWEELIVYSLSAVIIISNTAVGKKMQILCVIYSIKQYIKGGCNFGITDGSYL